MRFFIFYFFFLGGGYSRLVIIVGVVCPLMVTYCNNNNWNRLRALWVGGTPKNHSDDDIPQTRSGVCRIAPRPPQGNNDNMSLRSYGFFFVF